jgi:hypothetical protein
VRAAGADHDRTDNIENTAIAQICHFLHQSFYRMILFYHNRRLVGALVAR